MHTYFGVEKMDVFRSSSKDLRRCGTLGLLVLLSEAAALLRKAPPSVTFDRLLLQTFISYSISVENSI